MKTFSFGVLVSAYLISASAFGQKAELRQKVAEISRSVDGQVGVAIMDLQTKDTLVHNVHGIFPMQSVFKFPIALTVLDQVDKKKFSLGKKLKLTERDLLPNTWSPLREKYPDANVEVTVEEILKYMVSYSDNNACDILLRLVGGPKRVNQYVHKLGVNEIQIKFNEEEMHAAWGNQFDNWSKTRSMLKLLELFYDKKLLSQNSHDLLWKMMAETTTGPNRIKGLLPKDTEVLHRTGTGGTNEQGVNGAVNDIGIVQLPNGKYFAIVIYLGRVKGQLPDLERKIAEISLAAFNSAWLN
ncbi:MAG TPA: class A beta-lactamase, subclass A2 [Chryseosolibacter sp.]